MTNYNNNGDVTEIQFSDEEIEEARRQRHIKQEQQYELRRQQDIKSELQYKKGRIQYTKEEKANIKKLIFLVVIPLTVLGTIGILLVVVGEATSSIPLMIVGGIVAGVGYVPLLVMGIIVAFKRGIFIWW